MSGTTGRAELVAERARWVRVGAQLPGLRHRSEDRRLPRWGRKARLVFRICAGVAGTAYLLWGALLFTGPVGPDGRLLTDHAPVGAVLAVVIFGPGLLSLVTGAVWAASEAYAGYREQPRGAGPGHALEHRAS